MDASDPQSFDCFAEQYDAAAVLERNHKFFLAHLPGKRDSVLDLGCGTGLLAYELSRYFRSVVALDISQPMLAIARKKRSAVNIEYRHADANNLTLTSCFDAIVSHTTFHHLASIPRTLSAVKAALAPGGRLILIDCVTRFSPAIPRWKMVYYAYALLWMLPDCIHRGLGAAWTLFRFRVSRRWIEHLQSDRYISAKQFREIYGALLPGAKFMRVGAFMGVVWTVPPAVGTAGESIH